jgi:hypothetical protein
VAASLIETQETRAAINFSCLAGSFEEISTTLLDPVPGAEFLAVACKTFHFLSIGLALLSHNTHRPIHT